MGTCTFVREKKYKKKKGGKKGIHNIRYREKITKNCTKKSENKIPLSNRKWDKGGKKGEFSSLLSKQHD